MREKEREDESSPPSEHLSLEGFKVTLEQLMLTYDVVFRAERVDHSLVPVTSEPLDDDLQIVIGHKVGE